MDNDQKLQVKRLIRDGGTVERGGNYDALKAVMDELERLEKEAEQERQFICRKCGLRQELGKKTEANF